jgi:hypothetical protein
MSLSHRKRAPISEPLPCPECGKMEMVRVTENYRSPDGVEVGRLAHYRCAACRARFFDEEAIRAIQSARACQATPDRSGQPAKKPSLTGWRPGKSRNRRGTDVPAKDRPKRLGNL